MHHFRDQYYCFQCHEVFYNKLIFTTSRLNQYKKCLKSSIRVLRPIPIEWKKSANKRAPSTNGSRCEPNADLKCCTGGVHFSWTQRQNPAKCMNLEHERYSRLFLPHYFLFNLPRFLFLIVYFHYIHHTLLSFRSIWSIKMNLFFDFKLFLNLEDESYSRLFLGKMLCLNFKLLSAREEQDFKND